MEGRVVLHVDMDAFYASVEQRDHPELRGRPVLVGHDGNRGVVSAASYEAREHGCRSAMAMSVAKRLCPHAVVMPGRMAAYVRESRRIFEVFEDVAPVVEPLSIDEAFLDLTGTRRLLGDPIDVARRLRARIRDEIALTASVGVASNKFLAKLASDMDKPDGLTVIPSERVTEILDPLPIERMWGVGPATAPRLHAAGIRTFADARAVPRADLERRFGRLGSALHRLSRGLDERPVRRDGEARSVGQECTFGVDLAEPDAVRDVLLRQADAVAGRLRRHGLHARVVTVKIRFGDFETITRSGTLDRPSDLTRDLRAAARALFDEWVARSFQPVRLIGVTAGRLQHGAGQLGLFEPPRDVRERDLDRVVDGIRERFGSGSIRRGG
jgi:DNA polymerase-4